MIWDNYNETELDNYSQIFFSNHTSILLDKKKNKIFKTYLEKLRTLYPNHLLNKDSEYYNQSLHVLQKNFNFFLTDNNELIQVNSLFLNRNDGFVLFEKKENILKNIDFINSFILFKFLLSGKFEKCDKFDEFSYFYILENCIKKKNNGDFEYVIHMKLMKNTSNNINNIIIDQLPKSFIQDLILLVISFLLTLYLIKKLYTLNDEKF
jgi:hypothetical protein